jgi:hypothetical protein
MEVNIRIDSGSRKIERLCNACEYCLDRMFNPIHTNVLASTNYYNLFYKQLEEMVTKYPHFVNNDLNISYLMKDTIKYMQKKHKELIKQKRFSH